MDEIRGMGGGAIAVEADVANPYVKVASVLFVLEFIFSILAAIPLW